MPRTGLRREVDIGASLKRDLPWIVAAGALIVTVLLVRDFGFGWDSRAYWDAWRGPMYTTKPSTLGAYLYSPAFAQVTWPLAQLPFPAFASAFSAISAAVLAWLLAPLGWKRALPWWLAGAPEIASGNIFALLGAVAVLGLRSPGLWALPALTKITPYLGPVWFAVRGEWRKLLRSVVATLGVVGVSYLLSPTLWDQWVSFLLTHLSETKGSVGATVVPGPLFRVPAALALLVWGARTSRLWTLPVAMVIATPVFGIAAVTVCAALPRLKAMSHEASSAQQGLITAETAAARSPYPLPRSSNEGAR